MVQGVEQHTSVHFDLAGDVAERMNAEERAFRQRSGRIDAAAAGAAGIRQADIGGRVFAQRIGDQVAQAAFSNQSCLAGIERRRRRADDGFEFLAHARFVALGDLRCVGIVGDVLRHWNQLEEPFHRAAGARLPNEIEARGELRVGCGL